MSVETKQQTKVGIRSSINDSSFRSRCYNDIFDIKGWLFVSYCDIVVGLIQMEVSYQSGINV